MAYFSDLRYRAGMKLPADCLGFSSCDCHISATPRRNFRPCSLFDVEMLWVPLSSIVQVFPEVKSVRFADVALLSDLSLQELLAVFGETKVALSLGKHPSIKLKIKETT